MYTTLLSGHQTKANSSKTAKRSTPLIFLKLLQLCRQTLTARPCPFRLEILHLLSRPLTHIHQRHCRLRRSAIPRAQRYTIFPAATRSIMPGFAFGKLVLCRIFPEAGSISTIRLTPTSVTNAVLVCGEIAAQQVAFWPATGCQL